ncbi:nuclear distribution protein PAC1 [Physcia stellaris]|nr:nuclear distribution protein PAC1 [Physcia stellaris]
MSGYYSIDAILTDAQKVPCTFELDVPGLGYLDDNAGGDIKAHHTPPIPLPLWLAELLALQRFPAPSTSTSSSSYTTTPTALITLDLPECLGPRVMNALKADAKSVRLRELGGYWYAVLCRVLELFEEDELVGVGGVFRATHDSSKAMRVWMGELKRKR